MTSPRSRGDRWLLAGYHAFCALVLAFLLLPVLAVIPLSLNAGSFLTYPMAGWSMRWYEDFFTSARWLSASRNSAFIGAFATLIATALGTAAALGLDHVGRRSRQVLNALFILPVSTWEHRAFRGTWAGYHYPRHLQLFSRAGLTRLLADSGFVDVQLRSTPHAQTALSVQNWIVSRGWRPRLRFGRAPFFGPLLLLSLPIEVGAFLLDRSGVIDFSARRPDAPAARVAA